MARNKKARFANSVARDVKRAAGRTATETTPLAVRTSGVDLTDALRDHANARMSQRLGKFATQIERLTVRLEDVNGPRGGVDLRCRVKVVISGSDSVVYDAIAPDAREAIDRASHGIARHVKKALARAGMSAGRAKSSKSKEQRQAKAVASEEPRGSVIGRRVGHSPKDLEDALERPEKTRRDAYVDTSAPGVSASDRRAGGRSTARRNTKRNTRKATAMLEDSTKARPSRKSTRKSTNRAKRDSNLRRRQTRKVTSPRARASRAQARAR